MQYGNGGDNIKIDSVFRPVSRVDGRMNNAPPLMRYSPSIDSLLFLLFFHMI